MAEISFYILPSELTQERDEFACKLIEKAYRSGCFCYVLTDNVAQSQKIDDLLWTFRAGSFIPHQMYTGELPAIEKVSLIG
jgi:DNA polymerase-3 subunit chi